MLKSVSYTLALLFLPAICFAQAADATTAPQSIAWAAIGAVLAQLIALLVSFKQWLPAGWHTVATMIVGYGTVIATVLQGLPVGASIVTAALAVVAGVVARFRTKAGGWEK